MSTMYPDISHPKVVAVPSLSTQILYRFVSSPLAALKVAVQVGFTPARSTCLMSVPLIASWTPSLEAPQLSVDVRYALGASTSWACKVTVWDAKGRTTVEYEPQRFRYTVNPVSMKLCTVAVPSLSRQSLQVRSWTRNLASKAAVYALSDPPSTACAVSMPATIACVPSFTSSAQLAVVKYTDVVPTTSAVPPNVIVCEMPRMMASGRTHGTSDCTPTLSPESLTALGPMPSGSRQTL